MTDNETLAELIEAHVKRNENVHFVERKHTYVLFRTGSSQYGVPSDLLLKIGSCGADIVSTPDKNEYLAHFD